MQSPGEKSFFFFQERIARAVAMELAPWKTNRATVNTQHWAPPPPRLPHHPLHPWTTQNPTPQIQPSLSSTAVPATKRPGSSVALDFLGRAVSAYSWWWQFKPCSALFVQTVEVLQPTNRGQAVVDLLGQLSFLFSLIGAFVTNHFRLKICLGSLTNLQCA